MPGFLFMNDICSPKDPFWDWEMSWYSEHPIFTNCFRKSIFHIWPYFIFWIGFISTTVFNKSPNLYFKLNNVIAIRMFSSFILIIDNAIQLISTVNHEYHEPIDIVQPVIGLITFVKIFALCFLKARLNTRVTGLLWIFHFIYFITLAVDLYSAVENHEVYHLILTELIATFIGFLSHFWSEQEHSQPELKASFPSKLIFAWVEPFIWQGYKTTISKDKLWDLIPSLKSELITDTFSKFWILKTFKTYSKTEEKVSIDCQKSRASILKPLMNSLVFKFLVGSLFKLLQDVMAFLSPIMLKLLIGYTSDSNSFLWHGISYAIVLFLVSMCQTILVSIYFHKMYKIGIMVRSSLTSVIYQKTLKLTNQNKFSTGEIVNLMSSDVSKLESLMAYVNMIWSGPLTILVAMVLLWQILGPSTLVGLFLMILTVPLNTKVSQINGRYQSDQLKQKDKRLKTLSEIFQSMKILKFHSWENGYQQIIHGYRNEEIKIIQKMSYFQAFNAFIWTTAPFIVSLATFATYILLDSSKPFNSEIAFVSLALFNLMKFPLQMLPMVIGNLFQAKVSVKRINKFLNSEELDEFGHFAQQENNDCSAVSFFNASFGTSEEKNSPLLTDITLDIKTGELVAIIGPVGSGKSNLLNSILGEISKLEGSISINGSISLVPQNAWIQNTNVKNNITFHKLFIKEKYEEIIEAVCLQKDLEVLVSKDETEIGENGLNLSGGQKSRINLARALYNDSDIYLLDSPLSAVDPHVGNQIFKKVIDNSNGYLKDKTRLWVTHDLKYLSKVDKIVYMENGKIAEFGTYDQLMNNNGQFRQLMKEFNTKEMKDSDEIEESFDEQNNVENEDEIVIDNSTTKQYKEEKTEVGKISWKVYQYYLKSMGLFNSLIWIVSFIIMQTCSSYTSIWLSHWSDQILKDTGQHYYLGIYTLIGVGQGLTTLIGSFVLYRSALKASNKLHTKMLSNLLKAPMGFHDTTPSGRLINRFAQDINMLDLTFPTTIRSWTTAFLPVMANIIIICWITPIFIGFVIVIGAVYYFLQKIYIPTARQLKRFESASKSPIYSHFSETVNGRATIRAYQAQDVFLKEAEAKLDNYVKMYYPTIVVNRWLSIRLEILGNIIVLIVTLLAVIGKESISPGLVALIITYALQITSTLNWLVRMTSELETNIISTERIREYTKIPIENGWTLESSSPKLPDNWPIRGSIEFKDYSTKYRPELNYVFTKFSVQIPSGRSVGIVGRTGSGKSSLILALFNILENYEGRIAIDGIDISTLDSTTLRRNITVIPQDPVLFSGTIRTNLDPMGEYSDEELWDSLEKTDLKSISELQSHGLDTEILENGSNFSQGQKQLICLSRGFLRARKTRILILDESTASLDLKSDKFIWNSILQDFSDSTILTVAHRVTNVLNHDLVLVLYHGSKAEFDSPRNLLENSSSLFFNLCQEANLVKNEEE